MMTPSKKQADVTPSTPTTNTPAPTTQAAPAPSKAQVTVDKLKEAWSKKGVSLVKLSVTLDGKNTLLRPDETWPVIQVGIGGGIVVPVLRSYQSAFDAATDAKALFEKQSARDQKRQASATAPAAPAQPKPAAPAAQPEQAKAASTTQRKKAQHEAAEQRMQAAQ